MSDAAVPDARPAAAMPSLRRPSLAARLVGLGSVFGKTFRDSRRTSLALGGVFGLLFLVTAAQVAEQFPTVAERLQMARQLQNLPPIFQGMLGQPIGIETLGGFLSWRIMNFLPVMLGIWSVVALSGLLAAELGRGSLDLVAAAPISRTRLAVEKLAGYLAVLLVGIGLLGVAMTVAFQAFGSLPEDKVPGEAIVGELAWLYLMVVFPGSVAFAASPLVGRGQALGLGSIVLVGSFVVNGFADTVAAFDQVRGASYFHVLAGHRPLAGRWDWPAIGAVAAVTVGLLGAGVGIFARRDLLVSAGGRVRWPSVGLWLRGPFTRAIAERLPAAVGWGLFLGLFGLVNAASADQFVETIGGVPQIVEMIRTIFPDDDILSAAGFLQLTFFSQAILIVTLAAGTLVAGWASDEGERRLEVVLGAPVARAGWALRSASAVLVAIAVITVLMAAGVAVGAATQTAQLGGAIAGLSVLGLYAMALAGIGLAVGGLVRPSLAAPVTVVLGLAFFLVDLIGSILDLPEVVLDLALNRHLGRPVLGSYDEVGIAACTALAVGGVLLCAIGMRRRDIGR